MLEETNVSRKGYTRYDLFAIGRFGHRLILFYDLCRQSLAEFKKCVIQPRQSVRPRHRDRHVSELQENVQAVRREHTNVPALLYVVLTAKQPTFRSSAERWLFLNVLESESNRLRSRHK